MQPLANNLNLAEMRLRQTNHHAAKAAIANEQIRAATKDKKFNFPLAAKFHDARQIILVRRFDINIRRPAHAQRRMLRQRLVAPNHSRARNASCNFFCDVFSTRIGFSKMSAVGVMFQCACFAEPCV